MHRTQKAFVALLTIVALVLPSLDIVLAKGGGGGSRGSTPFSPTCTEDTWSCGAWGDCTVQGKQFRTCTMTKDCTSAQTPRPAEEQNCTPSCTPKWVCGDWGACSPGGEQTRVCQLDGSCPGGTAPARPADRQNCTPPAAPTSSAPSAPAPTPTPAPPKAPVVTKPSCTADTIALNDWGGCEGDGLQRRTYTVTSDCPGVETKPSEALARVCPGLKCGQLTTLKERVGCRNALPDEEERKEYGVLYFPDYCRSYETLEEQQACINQYLVLEPCWNIDAGANRLSCGKRVTRVASLTQEKEACLAAVGSDREECTAELTAKVEHFVLFKLYDLSFRAKALQRAGRVEMGALNTLDVFVEESKQEINWAKNLGKWREVLQEAKDTYDAFAANATPASLSDDESES